MTFTALLCCRCCSGTASCVSNQAKARVCRLGGTADARTSSRIEKPGSPDRGLCHRGGRIPSISADPTILYTLSFGRPPSLGPPPSLLYSSPKGLSERGGWSGGCRGDALAEMPSVKPRAQVAFKDSMIRGILQFTLRIAFRCVLHRCRSQDIRC